MPESRLKMTLRWAGVVLMTLGSAAICGISERAMNEETYPAVPLAIACITFGVGCAMAIRMREQDL
jgi:hypothetical protein